jgi:hypothetical protein
MNFLLILCLFILIFSPPRARRAKKISPLNSPGKAIVYPKMIFQNILQCEEIRLYFAL